MIKLLVVLVGLIAIGNGELVLPQLNAPLRVTGSQLSDWYVYKDKFGKSYSEEEDRYRRNIFLATKDKITIYNELLKYGLVSEPWPLDIFADYKREELFSLRSILEGSEEEWDEYKANYSKEYDDFEDGFRKTVYFINKDSIEASNKLFEQGYVSYELEINKYADLFHDELPIMPLKQPVIASSYRRSPYPYPQPIPQQYLTSGRSFYSPQGATYSYYI